MVQIPLPRAHRLRAITLASPIKKLRPQPTERAPTAWHTNDEYKNADASEEEARAARSRMRAKIEFYPYPPPVTGYTNPALISVSARWGASMTDYGPPGGVPSGSWGYLPRAGAAAP